MCNIRYKVCHGKHDNDGPSPRGRTVEGVVDICGPVRPSMVACCALVAGSTCVMILWVLRAAVNRLCYTDGR
jgi:hypothetical protein